MGLLDKTQGAIMGLLGGTGQAGDPNKPKLWQYLDSVLLGGDIQQTQDAQRARIAQQQLGGLFDQGPGQQPPMPQGSAPMPQMPTSGYGAPGAGNAVDPGFERRGLLGVGAGGQGGGAPQGLLGRLSDAAANGVNISPWLNVDDAQRARQEAERPIISNTGQSIVATDRGGKGTQVLYSDPITKPKPPAGMRYATDGATLEIDPQYVALQSQVADVRRKAMVKNPLPSHARAQTTGGVQNGLPPGYVAR